MPKTSLFETNLYLGKPYKKSKNNASMTKNDFIKPGMTFTMHYEHNSRYLSRETDDFVYIIKAETVIVTVVSIRFIIEECCCSSDEDDDEDDDIDNSGLHINGCVLQSEHPIFVCVRHAMYGRPITLCSDDITVATGSVRKFLDKASS